MSSHATPSDPSARSTPPLGVADAEPQFSHSAGGLDPGTGSLPFSMLPAFDVFLGAQQAPASSSASPREGSGTDNEILQRNLVTLSIRNQRLARELAGVTPCADLWLSPTGDGVPGGGLRGEDALASILGTGSAGVGVQLASRYHPIQEAKALVETVDVVNAATVVVLGFGLGHHVRVLSERLKEHGLVVVFEPDVGLLRAVMEKIDLTSWMVRGNVVILTNEEDSAAIAEATRGFETMLTLGTRLVTHPPSAARLGGRSKVFADAFTEVLKAARTHIVTTLVQTEITLRNLLQNLDHYAAAPGVDDLRNRCKGKPAIVVSAGPSLARTIEQLAQPGVRDRFVIVAAQTVLKPLLARGIRPHFVTALDHHEISRRFYEGLTAADVEGVTLIAEAKANAAILDAFPGLIRCCGDEVLDRVLGASFARTRGKLPPGATVAHLAYYVARHLGCDPVILTGQDLGFTDGQYYAAGATIHNVWACELNEFNTLEMMEWERIARMKGMLRKTTDQLGRPIYTDEQMHTYLVQFERDFARDEAAGLTTLDATEGGVAKRHTRIVGLKETLDARREPRGIEPDPLQPSPQRRLRGKARAPVGARLNSLRADVFSLGEASRQSAILLRKMLDAKGDQATIGSLIKKVYQHRDQVQKLETANWLVHFLNQCGTFRRLRADRAIALAQGLSPLEVQAKQIERDLSNVEWLADAADQTVKLLHDASAALEGGAKVTRDDPGHEEDLDGIRVVASARRVVAAVLADPHRSALGTPRELSRELSPGVSILGATLARLARCKGLDGTIVFTQDPEACRSIAGAPGAGVQFVKIDAVALEHHQRAILAGRGWSRRSWRGGVAGLTCFDEVCPSRLLAPMLKERGIDAACLVGGDWSLLDPSITDDIIARYREAPARHRLTFCQGVPGVAPVLLDVPLLSDLASADHHFASVGGLLRYVPIAPQADAIARPVCVHIPTILRDTPVRLVIDSDAVARSFAGASGGPDWLAEPSESLLARMGQTAFMVDTLPEIFRINLAHAAGAPVPLAQVLRAASQVRARPDACVTLIGAGSGPHPHLLDIIAALQRGGVAGLHVRASIEWPAHTLGAILDAGVQVLGLDVPDPTGSLVVLDDLHKRRAANHTQGTQAALPCTWIVPRLTRCDATYESIENFYDACVMAMGACVLDPLPSRRPGERIQPLPMPDSARERLNRTTGVLDAEGVWRTHMGHAIGPLDGAPLVELWSGRGAPTPGAHA